MNRLAVNPMFHSLHCANRFAGRVTQSEFELLKPLLQQIPALQPYSVNAEFCSTIEAPSKPVRDFFKGLKIVIETFLDIKRINKAIAQHQKTEDGPQVMIQWVRFPTEQSKTLKLSNPCEKFKSLKCPRNKDGTSAVGRAVIGHNMINWQVYGG